MTRKMPICIGRNKAKYEAAEKEYLSDSDVTITFLAKKYECTRQCLTSYFKKKGIKIRSIKGRHVTTKKAKQLQEAERMFNAGVGVIEIAKKLNLAISTVSAYLNKNGYKTCKHPKKINGYYTVDESYFDDIDTEEKAYWFGFIMADGSVRLRDERTVSASYGLTIELAGIDRNHLEKFKKAIKSNVILSERKDRDMVSITIYNKHFAMSLAEKGCVPDKTHRGFIDDSLLNNINLKKAYLRGYCDGDGYIDKTRYRIVYTGCTTYFAKKIQSYLLDLGLNFKIKECIENKYGKRYHYHRVYCEDKKTFFGFLHKVYGDATIYLDRKYEIYQARTAVSS